MNNTWRAVRGDAARLTVGWCHPLENINVRSKIPSDCFMVQSRGGEPGSSRFCTSVLMWYGSICLLQNSFYKLMMGDNKSEKFFKVLHDRMKEAQTDIKASVSVNVGEMTHKANEKELENSETFRSYFSSSIISLWLSCFWCFHTSSCLDVQQLFICRMILFLCSGSVYFSSLFSVCFIQMFFCDC